MNYLFKTKQVFLKQSFPRVRAGLLGQVLQTEQDQALKAKKQSFLQKSWQFLLSLIIVVSLLSTAILFGPKLYYQVFPHQVPAISASQVTTALAEDSISINSKEETEDIVEEVVYEPEFDPNLPIGDWLIIPKIGVRSQLQATEEADTALETGIWLVPDYGKPGDRDLPMIVAGHRYGWQWWWKDDYWRYHSFYLLPDLEPGDTIEVISSQRKWVYEIYAGEEGEEISDYEADLIVYTCKHLNSPIRHFRYAKLIDPNKDTQAN
ncbi:MAG: hypothetical protein PVJ09_04400 [Candidatus Woesebacteria bacterium]|jgi:hypothetical protein